MHERCVVNYRVGVSEKLTILASQAAQVLGGLREVGLDPREFAWSEVPSGPMEGVIVSRLTHVPTGSYYQFDFADRNHYAIFSPGEEIAVDLAFPHVWENQLATFWAWRKILRREVSTPDPWSQFFSAADLVREGEEQTANGNERFSEAEVREYTRRLEAIRSYLLDRAVDAESRQRIGAKIDLLITSARSQGRRDWFFMAMGVLLTEIVDRGLDTEQVRHVFGLLVRGIQQLTGG